jgi:hypothetical protein
MKSVFAVMAVDRPEVLGPVIQKQFPNDFIELERGQWLVSAEGTSQAVCEKLGVIHRTEAGIKKGDVGSALVVAVSGYYGIKASNVWEWIKAHWETP